jgi:MscS family membrane protein
MRAGRTLAVLLRCVLPVALVVAAVHVCTAPAAVGAEAAGASAAATAATEDHGVALDLSDNVPAWARREFAGVALWQLGAAFLLILAGLILREVSSYAFRARIIPLLERTPFAFDHLLARAVSAPLGSLLVLAGIGAALAVLPLPTEPNVRGLTDGALRVLAGVLLVWFLFRVVDAGVDWLQQFTERTESKLDDQLLPLARRALKLTVCVVCFVWIVQLLGYNVSSLLAGLGIGGLAVALGLQDTLANLFGSVFIFLDRPFTIGDWIKIGEVEGTVEQIGFRSTRIRTWPATVVAIPNKTVAGAAVDNWSKMPKRRVVQTVGVTYETSASQMEAALATIRDIVAGDAGVDKEFLVIRFTDFGESSLNILLYYFTTAVAFDEHLATKERVNLAIMRALEAMELSIAFPTRTLYLEGGTVEARDGLDGPGAERG